MAERLTNTLEETPTKGFGLKFCSDRNCNSDEDCCNCYAFNQTINKLRQLEDIMERLGINFIEDLEDEVRSLKVDKYIYKKDRDTWKRACELACKWFKQTGFIGDQTKVDYFYQQAKKEGNDE